MSWDCPHLKKDECIRLKKVCQPLQKGCVLEGKVQFVESSLEVEDTNDSQKGDRRDEKA